MSCFAARLLAAVVVGTWNGNWFPSGRAEHRAHPDVEAATISASAKMLASGLRALDPEGTNDVILCLGEMRGPRAVSNLVAQIGRKGLRVVQVSGYRRRDRYDQQQNAAVASFRLPAEEVDESILDAPRPDMDPAVWQEMGTEKPELTEEAERVVAGVAEWAVKSGWIPPDAGVHIIGSIASNQYSDESDIDVHFYGNELDFKGKDPDDFNAEMRAAFKKFTAANP